MCFWMQEGLLAESFRLYCDYCLSQMKSMRQVFPCNNSAAIIRCELMLRWIHTHRLQRLMNAHICSQEPAFIRSISRPKDQNKTISIQIFLPSIAAAVSGSSCWSALCTPVGISVMGSGAHKIDILCAFLVLLLQCSTVYWAQRHTNTQTIHVVSTWCCWNCSLDIDLLCVCVP